jgi:hypothetical protein
VIYNTRKWQKKSKLTFQTAKKLFQGASQNWESCSALALIPYKSKNSTGIYAANYRAFQRQGLRNG